jgi:outer membrane protein
LNKLVKAVGLSFVIVSSSFFANAAEAAQKVGYVSTAYIISKFPQIETKKQEILRNEELLGPQGVHKLEIEINNLSGEGKIKQEAYKKKVQRLQVQARQEMMALIQKATTKVAEKEGFDMVVDSQALLYSDEQSNLTEKVLAEL